MVGVLTDHSKISTSVLDPSVTEDKLKAPTKGKPTNTAQLMLTLKTALKNWGDGSQDILKAFAL